MLSGLLNLKFEKIIMNVEEAAQIIVGGLKELVLAVEIDNLPHPSFQLEAAAAEVDAVSEMSGAAHALLYPLRGVRPHGIEVRPYPNSLHYVTPLWRAMDRFGLAQAGWQPYWHDPGVVCDTEGAKASAWTRQGKALVIVSLLQRTNQTVCVQFEPRKLGLKSRSIQVADALTSSPVPVSSNAVQLSFSGMSYRLLEVH